MIWHFLPCLRSSDSPFFFCGELVPMAILTHSPEIYTVKKAFFCNPKLGDLKSCRISSNSKVGPNIKLRICSRMKDCDDRVIELEREAGWYGQFSVPVKQGSKLSKEDEKKRDYYVNMGYAIRTLREEFPELFYRELSFNIYRDDIVFKDPLNTFSGIENYKLIVSALRFHGRVFFKALWIDIVSVWQPMENVIMVRWTVHGIPRVPWESCGRFDATSEYKLDKKGKIFEHRVDNIAHNSSPKFRVSPMEELIQSLGCPSTPKPTCFESSIYSPSK